ncbi:hypothetical protein ACJIZ3_008603 [Penstemon smallii]|uniref:Uncharacterized protein n=1 Tax=Penstemon smallii TaxID=265156 RepID=A0ABD3TA75_9LAMI
MKRRRFANFTWFLCVTRFSFLFNFGGSFFCLSILGGPNTISSVFDLLLTANSFSLPTYVDPTNLYSIQENKSSIPNRASKYFHLCHLNLLLLNSLPASPQPTLCGCKLGSGRRSPNSDYRVSSPPDVNGAAGWEFLCAAAGEVARMRKIEETAGFYSTKLLSPSPKPTPVTFQLKNPNTASGFYPNQTHAHRPYQQLQATQFEKMVNSGVYGQGKPGYQFQNGSRNGVVGRNPALSTAVWPILQQSQQQPETGTGVFLPRRFRTNPTDTRNKKPGCSVLLPEKVVHALNLNLDSVDSQSHSRGNGNFIPDYELILRAGDIQHIQRSIREAKSF